MTTTVKGERFNVVFSILGVSHTQYQSESLGLEGHRFNASACQEPEPNEFFTS